MEQTLETLDESQHAADGAVKEIWRVTIILSVLTIIELSLGYAMMGMAEDGFLKHLTKGVIIILMVAKAFYIVGYFMHLKHEIRNMIMTIVVPLFLFVWFITAFLTDGSSFKNDKNKWDRYHREESMKKAPPRDEPGAHKLN